MLRIDRWESSPMTLSRHWPSAAGLALGYLADRVLGDPRRGHPVAGIRCRRNLAGDPYLRGSAGGRRWCTPAPWSEQRPGWVRCWND